MSARALASDLDKSQCGIAFPSIPASPRGCTVAATGLTDLGEQPSIGRFFAEGTTRQ